MRRLRQSASGGRLQAGAVLLHAHDRVRPAGASDAAIAWQLQGIDVLAGFLAHAPNEFPEIGQVLLYPTDVFCDLLQPPVPHPGTKLRVAQVCHNAELYQSRPDLTSANLIGDHVASPRGAPAGTPL
jgi:hypothetical protein